jgi:hypothetical protein
MCTSAALASASSSRLARAVQAAVLAANPAGALQFDAEPLPRPVQAHRQIVCGDPESGGGVLKRLAFQINSPEQIAVLFRQARQEPLYALANHALSRAIRAFRKLGFKTFKRALAGVATPVHVDNAATQNPVKPCDGVVVPRRLTVRLERFQQTFLHDVFRQMRIADALSRKGDERFQILEQRLGRIHRVILIAARKQGNPRAN